jgi:hypothetical protein
MGPSLVFETLETSLFADDFDEDSVGEFATEIVDYAVFNAAFEDLTRGLKNSSRNSIPASE